jgi:hypothetical protein
MLDSAFFEEGAVSLRLAGVDCNRRLIQNTQLHTAPPIAGLRQARAAKLNSSRQQSAGPYWHKIRTSFEPSILASIRLAVNSLARW